MIAPTSAIIIKQPSFVIHLGDGRIINQPTIFLDFLDISPLDIRFLPIVFVKCERSPSLSIIYYHRVATISYHILIVVVTLWKTSTDVSSPTICRPTKTLDFPHLSSVLVYPGGKSPLYSSSMIHEPRPLGLAGRFQPTRSSGRSSRRTSPVSTPLAMPSRIARRTKGRGSSPVEPKGRNQGCEAVAISGSSKWLS